MANHEYEGSNRETQASHQRNCSRSRSPHRHLHSHHRKRRRTDSSPPKPKAALPFQARPLSKYDFGSSKELFALYLDVQKEIYLTDLDEKEVRGRWKSFLGKWNRGELAEGWYDPSTKEKANDAAGNAEVARRGQRRSPDYDFRHDPRPNRTLRSHDEDSEDDDFGPALPTPSQGVLRAGPAVPNAQDLELAAELRTEDAALSRQDIAYSRKAERKIQKERLEELVPRADPGSRERQLEKKREVAVGNAGFGEAKESGDVEVGDNDLMGDDGIDGYKKRKVEMERKKNERELRKEEQLRARQAERDERMKKAREKEDKTMEYLKALAKERYG
jgi:hypothetical protein